MKCGYLNFLEPSGLLQACNGTDLTFIMLRFQRLLYENLHKTYLKHLNCKLYYQQLHLKYLCNLARY